jgi:predicted nucleotidyltransferase
MSSSLAATSLTPGEKRVLERLVPMLEAEYGDDLHAVWLYGSRARGEPPSEDSDVDLLVVVDGDEFDELHRLGRLTDEAAEAEGERPGKFAARAYTPEHVAQRREIRSFFMQEVDRDKIVLFGEP